MWHQNFFLFYRQKNTMFMCWWEWGSMEHPPNFPHPCPSSGREHASWMVWSRGARPRGSEPVYVSDGSQYSLAAVPSRVILNFNTSIAHPPLLIAVADLLFMWNPLGCVPGERKTWVKSCIYLLKTTRFGARYSALCFGFLICRSERIICPLEYHCEEQVTQLL